MAQHAYSWNGSRIHVVVEDSIADAYNRAFDKFLQAQRDFKSLTGRRWTPADGNETLFITWDDAEMEAWNNMAQVVNSIVKLNGGSIDIQGAEMNSNYLKRVYTDTAEEKTKVGGIMTRTSEEREEQLTRHGFSKDVIEMVNLCVEEDAERWTDVLITMLPETVARMNLYTGRVIKE